MAVTEAKARWLAIDPAAELDAVTFSIEDLPGLMLGQADGSRVLIDATAAGWGWNAADASGRAPSMDLVRALEHELGHVLGHDHDEAGLMAQTLVPSAPRSAQRLVLALSEPVHAPFAGQTLRRWITGLTLRSSLSLEAANRPTHSASGSNFRIRSGPVRTSHSIGRRSRAATRA